jgi:hypothetical protein
MSRNSEIDSSSSESQLAPSFPNPFLHDTQTTPATVAPHRAAAAATFPWPALGSTAETRPNAGAEAILNGAEAIPNASEQAVDTAIAQREARQKMAVEALMADPAEMRRMFDDVKDKVHLDQAGNIELWAINEGLSSNSLSEKEKAFLVILRDDYGQLTLQLSYNGTATKDLGVSAENMAIIDKALNPKLNQDPIYWANARFDLFLGPLLGFAGGGLVGVLAKNNIDLALTSSVALAAVATAGLEGKDLVRKLNGTEDKQYDAIAKQYRDFEAREKLLPAISFSDDLVSTQQQ